MPALTKLIANHDVYYGNTIIPKGSEVFMGEHEGFGCNKLFFNGQLVCNTQIDTKYDFSYAWEAKLAEKKDKFCLYFEVQDSGVQNVLSNEKDENGTNLLERYNYKPLLFNSVEEAKAFRKNPKIHLVNMRLLKPWRIEIKHCYIRLYE